MPLAFTREVPPSINACELTHLARSPIEPAAAAAQHRRYEALLEELGCVIRRVDAAPDLPDSVFVEDTAVVLDELAIIARPGAPGRRPETHGTAAALKRHRELRYIEAPATLDGGDVLCIARRIFVGVSERTTADAARQLEALLRPLGYTIAAVEVRGCLHLKTGVTAAADDLLVVNPSWVDDRAFEGFELMPVHPQEPFAANVLRIGDAVVCADAGPRTAEQLRTRGLEVHTVDLSELAKAEGGVTCCSILC